MGLGGSDLGEEFEGGPGGGFGDGDVRIVGNEGFAVGGIDDAYGEARGQ